MIFPRKTTRFPVLELCAAVLLAVASSSRAAEQSDESIAPFVDAQTLVVVRGELDRIDQNAVFNFLIDGVKDPRVSAGEGDMLRKWWGHWFDIGQGPMAEFRGAGVKRVYWLLDFPDLIDPDRLYGTWVFPIEQGTDAQKVMEVARGHNLEPHRIGQVIAACGAGRALKSDNVAALPPAWAQALTAEQDAAIQVGVVPTEVLRRSFEENVPGIPTPKGMAPIRTLTRGIEWIGISVKLPPDPRIRMGAQSPDAGAARAVGDLLEQTLPNLGGLKWIWKSPTLLQPAEAANLPKPEVANNQVRWDLDLRQALTPLTVPWIRQAIRNHSAANMRQILQGLLMYANNHKGQTPPDLDALIKDQDMSPQVLIDPLNPGEKSGYVYVRPAGDWQNRAGDLLVLYESTPNGQNIGYADGHVEWWPTHQQVLDQAKAAEARNRAAGEKK